MNKNDLVVRWLLESKEPAVRYITLKELLDEKEDSLEIKKAKEEIINGPIVKKLLEGQKEGGGFGVHPYQKWTGAHWRLVSLVELQIPKGNQKALAALNQVIKWLTSEAHLKGIKTINGLTRRCTSQEGNALLVASRLGFVDERVKYLAKSLVKWQWPDGGWNCDKREEAKHSSFHESLIPLWGLIEYNKATGDETVKDAIEKASEFFLRHRLFRSEKTGKIINENWLKLYYPSYWHYNILQALRVFSLIDKLKESRAKEALDIIEGKRLPDQKWRVEGCYWNYFKQKKSGVEVVDWGRKGENIMITLNALRVLKAAKRV